MTMQQLIYIVEIQKQGSFNRAAKALFISQPSLSQSISELERELGFQIFERTSKGAIPTRNGTAFIERCQTLVSQYERLKQEFISRADHQSHLSISSISNSYIRHSFLDMCLGKLMNENFIFRYRSRETYEVINDIANQISDLGFIMISPLQKHHLLEKLQGLGLVYMPIGSLAACFLMSADNPFSGAGILSFADLREQTFVFFGDEDGTQANYWPEYNAFDPAYFVHKKSIMLYDYYMYLTYLYRNPQSFATSFTPPQNMLDEYKLKIVPIDALPPFELGYILRKADPVTREMHRIIERVRASITGKDLA